MGWTLTIEVDGEERDYTFGVGAIAHAVCDGYERQVPLRPYRLMGPDGIRSNLSPTDSTVSRLSPCYGETDGERDLLEVR